MTTRVTTLQGADVGAYYVERELGYYLDAGEPPGVWHGDGAQALGLTGSVVDDDFLALMDGLDPRTGEMLGTKHTHRTARGFDVTCSAPKSVSVLFAVGQNDVRREVLEAHDAAVGAVVAWIEAHSQTRFRVQGEICSFDADGIVAACFRQHTSRTLDPQLHTHIVIANRVQAPDGRWLALDARTIKCDQQTLSRLYHAGLRAELTRRLAVRWVEPRNGIAEIADVPADVLVEFSQRSKEINHRIDDKIDAFVETVQRQPTPRERWRLEREAAAENRPAKTDVDTTALEKEWHQRLTALDVEPTRLIETAVGGQAHPDASIDVQALTDKSLTALAERQSTWRRAELVRELAAAVPTSAAGAADRLLPALDELADRVIADRMIELSPPPAEAMPLRRDGRPVTEAATERRLTLPEILVQEERLVVTADRRMKQHGRDHEVPAPAELTIPQRQLAAAVAGTHQLVLAVGPAGSGKTAALAPGVEQLRRDGRPVFGVAPSATAAEVLAGGAGIDADTLDKLLIEHRLDRPPEHRYDLPPAATIICDEAGMVPTGRMAELFELADRKGWRLALVGDPLQFAAVGRGGMFGHLVDTFGNIDLDQIHRFRHSWERDASLRLRRGDPTVVDVYDDHGRLHGGTARQMQRAVVRAWWDVTEAARTASMMAPTNEAVVALNQRAQSLHQRAGHLQEQSIEVGPYEVHVGDLIATRENSRRIRTDRNLMVKNRDHWTVEHIHGDGGLTVTGKTGRVRLPAAYVADNVELAYAETSHANQGRTVDCSFLYLDGATDCRGIYVPLSRGRDTNEAFVALRGEESPADVIADALARDWIDQPALQVHAELQPPSAADDAGADARLRPLDSVELRALLERNLELTQKLAGIRSEQRNAERSVTSIVHRQSQLVERLDGLEHRLEAARETVNDHDRPLHRRRHRIELHAAHLELDELPTAISSTRSELGRLEGKREHAAEEAQLARQLEKQTPQLMAEHTIVQHKLELDVIARGQRLALCPTPALADRLGPFPADHRKQQLWIDAAGKVAQHNAAFDNRTPTPRGERSLGAGTMRDTHEAATRAIQRLDDAARHTELTVERPSLGLSL